MKKKTKKSFSIPRDWRHPRNTRVSHPLTDLSCASTSLCTLDQESRCAFRVTVCVLLYFVFKNAFLANFIEVYKKISDNCSPFPRSVVDSCPQFIFHKPRGKDPLELTKIQLVYTFTSLFLYPNFTVIARIIAPLPTYRFVLVSNYFVSILDTISSQLMA